MFKLCLSRYLVLYTKHKGFYMTDLINGFKHHTITRNGIITNTKTGNTKSTWIGANGYYHVDIQEFGKPKKVALHRLLALQYIPNPENKRTVNHIDGNKVNNMLENLEWATDSENVKHAFTAGLHPDQKEHPIEFFQTLLPRFFAGESITSISKDPNVRNTLTQTSIHLRHAAIQANVLDKYENELKRQELIRKKVNGALRCKSITLQMIDLKSQEIVNTFTNITEAKNYLNVKSCGPISNVLAGRQKTAYGYFWVSI